MPSLPTQLAEILDNVQHFGKFFAAAKAEIYMPNVEVEGVGPIALPLLPLQAEQLIALAEQAPYGKGEETLVDVSVRRTWQIGADKIQISGKHWAEHLADIVAWTTEKLGIKGEVHAELYKLLIYDTGSFFVSHRDTEKAPGMFATLVMVLPSRYTGGELIVRHRGEEARIDLSTSDPSEVAYAAFYADCKHEVLPVTSGCRLTLIFNLIRADKTQAATPPEYQNQKTRFAEWLRDWCQSPSGDETPVKLIYPLEHAYSQAELSFAALKGTDASRAAIAVAAAEQAGCDLHLALVSIEESGWAEHAHYRPRKRWYADDDDDEAFEIGEVTETEQFLSHWRKPDDTVPTFDDFPFELTEVCPPDAFEGLEPDELDFEEATGNAGASFERSYHRAALVFWPALHRLAVLNQSGLRVTLPYLGDLAERWMQTGKGMDSELWQEAHELSHHMLQTWPSMPDYNTRYDKAPGRAADMLDILERLHDTKRLDECLVRTSANGDYGMGDNGSILRAVSRLPASRSAQLIQAIVARNVDKYPGACANLLLKAVAEAWAGSPPTQLAGAAQSLVDRLPSAQQDMGFTYRSVAITPDFVVDLMTALEQIDPELANRAADFLLSKPDVYHFDAMLVPALVKFQGPAKQATGRLRTACLSHLDRRIAEPLEPPADWARASTIACSCKHCGELSRFLADPRLEEWLFKAVEHERSHVEESIRRANSDLNLRTETRGRPYTLICRKNQASYERRRQQRHEDLHNQSVLRASATR